MRGFFGKEYTIFTYRQKRSFINNKYNLNASNNNAFKPIGISNVLNAPCVNEDFEASPVTTCTVVRESKRRLGLPDEKIIGAWLRFTT